MRYGRWQILKKYRQNYVEWTGSNVDEVEAFAYKYGFGFVVGSPVHCSLDHEHFDADGTDPCEEREDVLEVYSRDWFDVSKPGLFRRYRPSYWMHADPGDIILADGKVKHVSVPGSSTAEQ